MNKNIQNKRRTKIIATLGPATNTPNKLQELLESGIDLIRLNFSHGHHKEHLHNIEQIRKYSQENNIPIGIIADLQGPKIRVTELVNSPLELIKGNTIEIVPGKSSGDASSIGVDYQEIIKDIKPLDILLLDDGQVRLEIVRIDNDKITCTIQEDGKLASFKGVNKLGGGLSTPSFTEKDKLDLDFALEHDVDYIAVSFVKDGQDLEKIKSLIKSANKRARVIAKVERHEAIENLTNIIESADAVMVARGDLGVEIGIDKVPSIQKLIIEKARRANKAVITATQIMESMVANTIPTRAEVSDIANAVLDGTDAIMFSAETATGKHPQLVVKAANQICISSEENPITSTSHHRIDSRFSKTDEAIAMGAMYIANHQNISAIITFTETGSTPLMMSRIRTNIPIYAFSQNEKTVNQMKLYRDVYPIYLDYDSDNITENYKKAFNILIKKSLIDINDSVIITHGSIVGTTGATNTLKIEKVF